MTTKGLWASSASGRVVRVAALAAALLAPLLQPALGKELSEMNREEIVSLQRRLTDAGCYTGALDGTASAAMAEAVKACPVMDPILTVETGMHTSSIWRIGVDSACRLLATGSEDKTVRLWSLPEGRLLRILRPPIGTGNDGKIHAVAVSPDGSLVAAGGRDAHPTMRSIYLFDAQTGALKARVGAFEGTVHHLAFSPDGRHLAAALVGGHGLRVIDVASRREIAKDTYGGGSYGVAFAPDGRLFTAATDGFLRAYDRTFRLTKKVATSGGKQPYGIAVDPSGERVAVGFYDSPKIDVYRTSDLRQQSAVDTSGLDNGNLSVAWSSDGRQLAAGGSFMLLWDQGGRGQRRQQAVADSTIMHILPCGSGFALGAADPLLALTDGNGAVRVSKAGAITDMAGKLGDAFQISRDGRQVRFGLGIGDKDPALFDLAAGTLTPGASGTLTPGATGTGLAAPRTSGLTIADWENTTEPKLDGTALKLGEHEISRSLAIAPDARSFVLGTDKLLRVFDTRGRQQWQKPVPGNAFGVNLTVDGRLVVAASGDGTIRWYRMADGQELLTLFVHKDRRWVAWTPSGYYQASPGAEDLIGWHLNRGWEQAADFFPASRFRDRFSRPDVVQLVLETLDEDQAVKQANAAARRRDDGKAINRLPPVIRITSPAEGASFSGGEVGIGYDWRSPSGLQVDKIEVLIDGRPLQARGFDRIGSATNAGAGTGTQTVSLPARDVEVALIARAGELASEPARVRLTWGGGGARGEDLLKPKLYALVIGVSDYASKDLKLGYAAKDARDFAAALNAQSGGMYGSVETRIMTDREVTRASMIRGLRWLEQQVTSRDVGVLFLAGHGVNDKSQGYWFLPADATPEDVDITGISQDDIKRTLQRLAGKAMLFLDTCHAGQALTTTERRRSAVDINSVVNDFAAAENGVVAFASSTGRQVSVERDEWQNGAFTKALIEGLVQGRADLLGKGSITLSQLDAFVVNRVKELTGGTQHPVMTRPPTVPDFPIAVVRR